MTHKDIYTKFMIEYDKANVTSSYPSLTEYEVATVLDKAYNALIAQKVTGNNVRRVGFEGDLKSVEDLSPLVVNTSCPLEKSTYPTNAYYFNIPSDYLYFVQCMLTSIKDTNQLDEETARYLPVKLVTHEMAKNFFSSAHNIPWVKEPVCYRENNKMYVVADPIDVKNDILDTNADISYIKKPNTFAKDTEAIRNQYADAFQYGGHVSYFDYETNTYTPTNAPASYNDYLESVVNQIASLYEFECNDTVAEELISLAVTFALENVESQRLNSKLNTRGLEA